jgi:hypothetical protein
MTTLVRFYGLVLVAAVVGCTSVPENMRAEIGRNVVLLDPVAGLDENWQQMELGRGETSYAQVRSHLGTSIKATGNHSASILYKVFEGVDLSCTSLQWDWLVAELQETSNLRQKGMDDVGASILISFGDPGVFRDKRVPILKYVWANSNHKEDDIIIGPYQTRYLRTIVVRSGLVNGDKLVREKRDLVRDYQSAFGKPPGDKIYAIGLFTDNDDTKEPVTAYYGTVVVICDDSSR